MMTIKAGRTDRVSGVGRIGVPQLLHRQWRYGQSANRCQERVTGVGSTVSDAIGITRAIIVKLEAESVALKE